jgi:hypothetical protein
MSPQLVSQWIFSRFKGVHEKRLLSLSAVLWGFLSVSRLSLAELGRHMDGPARPRHRIKRAHRLITNSRFKPQFVMKGLTREAAARFKPLCVALDWVELRGGCRALVAAACLRRGRALPLAWTVVRPAEFRRSQNAVEDALVAWLAVELSGVQVCLVLVADRGFRRASFLAHLDALGLGYVIRVCEKVHVSSRRYRGLLSGCGLRPGAEGDLGEVEYREDGVVRTRLVWRWRSGAAEPWLLATNRSWKLGRVAETYARRMETEESFRDLKSHRWGAALRYVKLSGPERYARLLAIWALGMWLLLAQGAVAVTLGRRHGLSTASNRRRDLSLITIGRLLLAEFLGTVATLLRRLAGLTRHRLSAA